MKKQVNRGLVNRGFAFAATVAILASTTVPAFAATYTDINRYWAKQSIQNLVEKDIFVGYHDQTFRPTRKISRAEFVTVLMRALGARENYSGTSKFVDVPANHPAAGYISQAASKDLIDGYDQTSQPEFRPTAAITRGEALAMLSKVILGQDVPEDQMELILKNYNDAYRLSTWNKVAVAKTIEYNVFKSANKHYNTIRPNETIQRGEAAYLIDNLMKHNDLARQPQIEVYHQWAKVIPDESIRFPQGIDHRRTKSTYTTTVATPISSEFNAVGDKVTLVLNEPVVTSNGITLEPGSKVMGQVTEVKAASWNETAALNISFDEVVTPDGKVYDVKGTVASTDGFLRGNAATPVKKVRESSYQALKSQIKTESGAHSRHQQDMVFYQNQSTTDSQLSQFVEENKSNFVLVGVGDQLELNFNGPAS